VQPRDLDSAVGPPNTSALLVRRKGVGVISCQPGSLSSAACAWAMQKQEESTL